MAEELTKLTLNVAEAWDLLAKFYESLERFALYENDDIRRAAWPKVEQHAAALKAQGINVSFDPVWKERFNIK